MQLAMTPCAEPRFEPSQISAGRESEISGRRMRRGFAAGVASTPRERVAALRLVYENYVARGMIARHPYRLRVTAFHLLPTTTIFMAREFDQISATVTLIGDGPMGLPSDAAQPDVVDELRQSGHRIAEVSCLAFHDWDRRQFLPVFIEMTRVLTQFARAHGVDQLLIGCVPRHANFYRRFLGFEQIGEMRPYSTVCNTPGVACRLDLTQMDWERPDLYERYFGTPVPAHLLQRSPMTEGERDAYAHVIDFEEQPVLMDI